MNDKFPMIHALVTRHLDDASVGREIALKNDQPAGLLDRIAERMHDFLAFGLGREVGQSVEAALRDLAEALGSQAHTDCQAECWRARIALRGWRE